MAQVIIIMLPCISFKSSIQPINTPNNLKLPAHQKTFLQALNNVCDIPCRKPPRLCVKWDRITITVLEEEYLPRFETCKNNLHDRIIWPIRVPLLKADTLPAKLSVLCKSLEKC